MLRSMLFAVRYSLLGELVGSVFATDAEHSPPRHLRCGLQHVELVDGPVGAFGAAGVGDADEFGFSGLGEEEVGGADFFALAFEDGFVPGLAVLGDFDLPATRPVIARVGGVEGETGDVGGLRQFDLHPHAGRLRGMRVPAGLGIAVDGFGEILGVVAGGELPGAAIFERKLRAGAFELLDGPRRGAGGEFLAQFGDFLLRDEAALIAKALTHVAGDVGEPFVGVVRHRDHLGLIRFAVHGTTEAVEEHAEDLIAVHGGLGAGERRGERHAGREAVDGGAFAIESVAGEAQLLVNGLATAHLVLLRIRELTREAELVVQHLRGELLHAFRRRAECGEVDEFRVVLPLHLFRREQGLRDDGGIAVLRQSGDAGFQRGIGERFAGADGGASQHGRAVLQSSTHLVAGESAQTFERPQRMNASEVAVVFLQHRGERGHDALVLFQDEQLLRGVAMPAVRMREGLDELRGRGVEQFGSGHGLGRVMHETPHTTAVDDLVHAVLEDHFAQVAAFLRPVSLLDDAAIHVADEERAIGRGFHIDGAETGVRAAQELALWMRIVQNGDAVLHLDRAAAHETAHGLAKEEIAAQLGGQLIASEDLATAGRGEMVQRVVLTRLAGAALIIAQAHRRPHDLKAGLELRPRGRLTVEDVVLEIERAFLAARVHHPELALVILRRAPLAAVAGNVLLDELAVLPAQAVVVHCGIDPVVERPRHAAWLMLKIAAARAALIHWLLFIAHTVAVGVLVEIDVVRVGLADQHAIGQRQQQARQLQLVGKDAMHVVLAIALARPMHGHAARAHQLVRAVDVAHVAAHLRDEEPAVAIKSDANRLRDVRLAQDQLHAITGRQLESLLLLRGCERLHRRLRWEVGGVISQQATE